MKLLNYKDDIRWNLCSEIHKHHGVSPSWFITVLLQYKDQIRDLENINIAIETGTHKASTTLFFAEVFDQVYTVEKYATSNNVYSSENLIDIYKEIIKTHNNIHFYEGDSPKFIQDILPTIKERCVILLDAHSMSSSPLREELIAIKQSIQNNDCVIIVDDTADLGSGSWPSKSEMEQLLLNINPNFKFNYTGLARNIMICFA